MKFIRFSCVGLAIVLGYIAIVACGSSVTTRYLDSDGDGYGCQQRCGWMGPGCVVDDGDCDDSDDTIYPKIGYVDHEVGVDTNCDGEIDDDFKYIFVTSSDHNGNLGGLAGADAICQALADAAGLPTATYKAWLSTSTVNANDPGRLTHSSIPYANTNFQIVAHDWADLVDGSLDAPVYYDEMAHKMGSAVWTGTSTAGLAEGYSNYCNDWTIGSSDSAQIGYSHESDSRWTRREDAQIACWGGDEHLYCLEQ